jgi:hypothetical protein
MAYASRGNFDRMPVGPRASATYLPAYDTVNHQRAPCQAQRIRGAQAMSVSPIQDIVADIGAGKMVILVDEEDRENEGDLVVAAEHVTPEIINFMVKHGRGLVCLTLTEARCR